MAAADQLCFPDDAPGKMAWLNIPCSNYLTITRTVPVRPVYSYAIRFINPERPFLVRQFCIESGHACGNPAHRPCLLALDRCPVDFGTLWPAACLPTEGFNQTAS